MAAQIKEWVGIQQFPTATQAALGPLLNKLRESNVEEITVLVLGKGGVGKSSTINSLLGERAVTVTTFQAGREVPEQVSRRSSGGFSITCIDTPGLLEAGDFNELNMERIRKFCLNKKIDVMLYVDRLDVYHVDTLDRKVIQEITRAFGKQIWKVGGVVLTHANMPTPASGATYEQFVAQRSEDLLGAIRREAGLGRKQQLPVLLVENSSRVKTNDGGEKILPNNDVFLVKLVEGMVSILVSGQKPVVVTQELLNGPDANKRGKIWIPLLLLAQYFLIVKPLRRAIRSDLRDEMGNRPLWELRADDYADTGRQRYAIGLQEEYKNEVRLSKAS